MKISLMFTPMGRAMGVAGEEAVGHGVVLAYILCIRDAGKYAKPEVDLTTSPPPPPFYHSHTLLSLYFSCIFSRSLSSQ